MSALTTNADMALAGFGRGITGHQSAETAERRRHRSLFRDVIYCKLNEPCEAATSGMDNDALTRAGHERREYSDSQHS
jgi:hypothetical protein